MSVTDEHRKLANQITTATNVYGSDRGAELLADFERTVRLEEAKWWHTRVAMVAVAGGDDGHEIRTETRERISELEVTGAASKA